MKLIYGNVDYHLPEFEHSECVEKITIYLEGFKNSPLLLSFREEDNLIVKTDVEKEKWCVGYPDDGVIWLFKSKSDENLQTEHIDINLNRPAVIAELIKYFILNGWKPNENFTSFVEGDSLKFLEVIGLARGIN